MPTYGEEQKAAGVAKQTKTGESASSMRRSSKGFEILDPIYKGNAVLNANK